jgi:hypothetical protein
LILSNQPLRPLFEPAVLGLPGECPHVCPNSLPSWSRSSLGNLLSLADEVIE